MKIKFLQDYQGQWTGVHFYREGQVVDLDDAVAEALIGDGRAVAFAPEPAPKPAPATPVKPQPKARGRTGEGVL